jgi:hypothetical protein
MTGQEQADQDAIVDLVVRELSKGRSPNEVARLLCEQGRTSWGEAEQLVRNVKRKHRRRISRRKIPTMIALIILSILFGVVMLIVGFRGFGSEVVGSRHYGFYSVHMGNELFIGSIFIGLSLIGGAIGGTIELIRTLVVISSAKK